MISTAFNDGFGFDFDNFREWDLVENEDLRRWMKHHEDLVASDPFRTISGCILAHGRIIGAIKRKTMGYSSHRTAGDRVKQYVSATYSDYFTSHAFEAVVNEFQQFQEEVERRFHHLEMELVTVGVGMPVMETRRFLQSSEGVLIADYGGGRMDIAITGLGHSGQEVERATFMLNYLSRPIHLVKEGYPGVLDEIKLELPQQP
jgi:hypothetical protein